MENISQNRQTSSMGDTPIIHDIPTETTGPDEPPMKKRSLFTLCYCDGYCIRLCVQLSWQSKIQLNVTKLGSKCLKKMMFQKSAGIADKKTFKDSAEGSLEEK